MMKITSDASEARAFSRAMRKSGKTIGFVPTMGFLHDGHISLLEIARAHADVVVASVYVNPLQGSWFHYNQKFAVHEDFGQYPRDVEGDRKKLEDAGCDLVFEPTTMYSGKSDGTHVIGTKEQTHQTYVQVEKLEKPLCGQSRPHFFRGVATAVAKLFNIVEPDVAVFGSKDYQQGKVVQTMVRELNFPVKIVLGPIKRELDGLAMSSRNARLTPDARKKALVLVESLRWAEASVLDGLVTTSPDLTDKINSNIIEAGGIVDYIEVVDAETLEPILDASKQACVLAVAAFFPSVDGDNVRLIDNQFMSPKGSKFH